MEYLVEENMVVIDGISQYYTFIFYNDGFVSFKGKVNAQNQFELLHTRSNINAPIPPELHAAFTPILDIYIQKAKDLGVDYFYVTKPLADLLGIGMLSNRGFHNGTAEVRELLHCCGMNYLFTKGWVLVFNDSYEKLFTFKFLASNIVRNEIGMYTGNLSTSVSKDEMKCSFIFQERPYDMVFSLELNANTLTFGEDIFPCQGYDETNVALLTVIEIIRKNHRLQLLFNPPMQKYNEFMIQQCNKIPVCARSALHDLLLTIFNAEDIERKCMAKPSFTLGEYESFLSLYIFDFHILISKSGDLVRRFEKNDEAMKEFVREIYISEAQKRFEKECAALFA